MGGQSSGRCWHYDKKDTTDNYRRLDIRRWQRDGLLKPGLTLTIKWWRSGETFASLKVLTEQDRVILNYRHRKNEQAWQDERYPVYLTWTPCTYGGARAWFLCPVQNCGRRVAILYGGRIFACRHCYKLAYACQREADYDRAARRVNKIRDRLKWKIGFLNGEGCKPKGMHRRTFERLKAEHDSFVDVSVAGIMHWLKR
ncbi:hypothetical protein [Nitrosomonas communis]|uniref:Uncharacterized protein n=1 Tax=Nitrosomonas communis TaxID=44574 RepID=A0A1I4UAU3_9PROT|nr:hypothetical protein [Nitrosomonas communis]SFM86035.1 hypothetical protein SAMN05421863_10628 [Nitrosomonas communis]